MATKPAGKKGLSSRSLLKQEFANKRESMIREQELSSFVLRETLGISTKGDMAPLIKEAIKKLKKAKFKRKI